MSSTAKRSASNATNPCRVYQSITQSSRVKTRKPGMTARLTSTIPTLIAALAAGLLWCMVTTAYSDQAKTVRDGGAVSGFVRYRGTPPSPARLAITKDREVCGASPVYDQSLVVGPDHGVANAVVTLADTVQAARLKAEPAVQFDQKECQYIPHVAV